LKAPAKTAARLEQRPRASAAPTARLVVDEVTDDVEERQPGGGVQSIGRAFAILEEVARNREGIGLADLSKRVGLHNSTTFHLVKTMVSLGYLRQLRDKRYRIGRPLFALAASALDEMEMVSMATPVLEQLSLTTGESSHFAVRMSDDVVVMARTPGPSKFQLTDRVGVVRPAYCTALGKVILASLRPEQFDRYLDRVELKPLTPKTITERQRFVQEIEDVRASGIGFDDGEFDEEVRCAAMPVRDFSGQVVGAIGISGPVWRLTFQAMQSRTKALAEAADELSAGLGAAGGGQTAKR
jgi:DNA-binding IclR family transcriptional regulator